MNDLNNSVARAIGEILGQQLSQEGYDMVDLVPIPTRGDRMVRLRTLEEALADFESPEDDQIVGYLIQVRPRKQGKQLASEQTPAQARTEPPQAQPIPKAGPESIYLPNGRINVQYLSDNAELLLRAREYALARNIYNTILQSGERTASAHFGLGRCFEAEGKLSEAISAYEESLTYHPALDTYQRLSAALIKVRKDARAAETMERALGLKDVPQSARFELHKACGNCWTRSGKPDSAEKHYSKALEINPSADGILANLGALMLQKDRVDQARQYFEKAVAINMRNDKAYAGLGNCALAANDKRAAHDCFTKSLDINLNNPTALFHLVKCAYEIKSYATAARIVGDYIQVAPVNANLLYSLAGLQFHLGRIEEARATASRIIELQPEHSGAKELLALVQQYSPEARAGAAD